MSNPFFEEWDTPFGIPPFDRIKDADYKPAFDKAFSDHNEEIDAIVSNSAPATFENTIEALERSASLVSDEVRL